MLEFERTGDARLSNEPDADTRNEKTPAHQNSQDKPVVATSTTAVMFVAPEPLPPSDQATGGDRNGPAERGPRSPASSSPNSGSGRSDDNDDEETDSGERRRRRRGRRGRGRGKSDSDSDAGATAATEEAPDGQEESDSTPSAEDSSEADDGTATAEAPSMLTSTRRRLRRRRRDGVSEIDVLPDDPPNTVVHVREGRSADDEVQSVRGSTRLEAKRQRRRDGRDLGRRRPPILTEAEFLARREAVDRVMVVRQQGDRTQIAVLEDNVLVEHYVSKATATSYAGNVYLGRVQNVLPSMEAAFVDIGKGRNAVLYAGEVNWDVASMEGKPRQIEQALKSGDAVVVQVTKDPIGHKGARLTSQVSLPGRYLVFVPGGSMTGISRKLPDTERTRLKDILRKILPEDAGVIIRTAAEGASEEELTRDVARLQAQWEVIQKRVNSSSTTAPTLLYDEPDLAIRVVRDIFNEDFSKLVVSGDEAWDTLDQYVAHVAPDLSSRLTRHVAETDAFADYRIDEQLAKALDRKVWLPSGGSLVIDRTEAMTVIDVNTGKFVGGKSAGGTLEETVTRNNLEAAEEIVRQLRLRDIGGIIVIDFIDMVLESNRELVLRRLTECLGRDRTKHQVAEVTSLGLVQMTRKRVGQGLLESFSEPCEHCKGRGVIIYAEPVDESKRRFPRGNGEGARGKVPAGDQTTEPSDDVSAVDQESELSEEVEVAAAQAAGHPDTVESSGGALAEEDIETAARPRGRRTATRPAGPPDPVADVS